MIHKHLATCRHFIVRHHKYAWAFTAFALLIVGGVYFKKEFVTATISNTFTQSSFIGGATTTPAYQTGWNKYESVDGVSAGYISSIPVMDSFTTPSGTASSSMISSDNVAWKAFDKSLGNQYLFETPWNDIGPHWLSYQFPSAKTIIRYSIISPWGSPKTWTFQGSNAETIETGTGSDGITGTGWVVLDRQTNYTTDTEDEWGWDTYNAQAFVINNTTGYLHYRLYVTNKHANYLVIHEMQMFEAVSGDGVSIPQSSFVFTDDVATSSTGVHAIMGGTFGSDGATHASTTFTGSSVELLSNGTDYSESQIGTFTSAIINFGEKPVPTTLTWEDSIPTGTTITMKVRASIDGTNWPDAYADIIKAGTLTAFAGKKYFQYEATLTTPDPYNTTPTLNSVKIYYNEFAVGDLTSSVYDTVHDNNGVTRVAWTAPGTTETENIKFQVRSSPNGTDSWSEWCGQEDTGSTCEGSNFFTDISGVDMATTTHPLNTDGNDRYIQYKAFFVCGFGQLILTSVTITHTDAWDGTPPVITASVLGGTYTLAQSVILSTNEPATIYYTTDGSTPTASSPVYATSTPIQISITTALNYFGIDTIGNSSTVVTQIYTMTTYTFSQARFNGGISPTTANHTSNQTGWSMYESVNGLSPVLVNAIPVMESDTAPSGIVSYSSKYQGNYHGYKAFNGLADGNDDNSWFSAEDAPMPQWLSYQFPSAKTIIRYSMQTDSDGPVIAWKFQGSNDGTSWTILDTQGKQTEEDVRQFVTWEPNEIKTFDILIPNEYLYYRIYATASDNDDYTNIAELQMLQSSIGIPQDLLSGDLTSSVYDTGLTDNSIARVAWTATGVTETAYINFQVRSSPDGETWSNWCGQEDCEGSNFFTASGIVMAHGTHPLNTGGDDRYIQYKAFFIDGLGLGQLTLNSTAITYYGLVTAPNPPPAVRRSSGSYIVLAPTPTPIPAPIAVPASVVPGCVPGDKYSATTGKACFQALAPEQVPVIKAPVQTPKPAVPKLALAPKPVPTIVAPPEVAPTPEPVLISEPAKAPEIKPNLVTRIVSNIATTITNIVSAVAEYFGGIMKSILGWFVK